MKYCTHCNMVLKDGEKCTCQSNDHAWENCVLDRSQDFAAKAPSFQIRRKQILAPFRKMKERTDFSDVLLGKDVDATIIKFGTPIDNIETLGGIAIVIGR